MKNPPTALVGLTGVIVGQDRRARVTAGAEGCAIDDHLIRVGNGERDYSLSSALSGDLGSVRVLRCLIASACLRLCAAYVTE